MPEYEFDYRDQQSNEEPEKEKDPKVFDIVDYPDPILRASAEPVDASQFKGKGAKELKKLVERMMLTVDHYDGIGLAAPQVGVSARLFVTSVPPDGAEVQEAVLAEQERWEKENITDEEEKQELLGAVIDKKWKEGRRVFINPELLEQSGESIERERCLSLPNISATVPRPTKIKMRALDIHGEAFEVEAEGMLARCLLHELDHCNGRLITDYSTGMERTLNEPKLKRLERDWHRQNTKAARTKKKRRAKVH